MKLNADIDLNPRSATELSKERAVPTSLIDFAARIVQQRSIGEIGVQFLVMRAQESNVRRSCQSDDVFVIRLTQPARDGPRCFLFDEFVADPDGSSIPL
jgi:hypothetical protein